MARDSKELENLKEELISRGLYERYHMNPVSVLRKLIHMHDHDLFLNETICVHILDHSQERNGELRDYWRYYPQKMSQQYYIDDNFLDLMREQYSKTLSIIKQWGESKDDLDARSLMFHNAFNMAQYYNEKFQVVEEDILLEDECPVLGVSLTYDLDAQGKYWENSAVLFRKNVSDPWENDNIWVISHMAYQIMSSLTEEELLALSQNMSQR